MIQAILKNLGGVQNYGIISLCLFGTVFIGVLLWAGLQKRSHLDYMARVALEKDAEETPNRKHSHE